MILSNYQGGGYLFNVASSQGENNVSFQAHHSINYRTLSSSIELQKMNYLAGATSNEISVMRFNDEIQSAEETAIVKSPSHDTYLILGGNPGGQYLDGDPFLGTIYLTRMYNRVLTDDEIEKNYVIDKARYGF